MPSEISETSEDAVGWLNTAFTYEASRNLWLQDTQTDFGYNDGDAHETYLLETIKSATDRSLMSPELAKGMKDWPSTYHLHHQRSNVFRGISHCLEGPILEIGAGCGALTRYLGEQGHNIIALEGSTRRASITAERCRDLKNVHVLNANFQDFDPSIRFQTITLIGVLEYARVYFSDGSERDPVDQMLSAVADMLEPNGRLIVAIENKLGLKYFAGYPEDHVGTAMFGIEDRYGSDTVATFGRSELIERLSRAGLSHSEFAYPFPDYKLPHAVLFEPALSKEHAPKFTSLVAECATMDMQKPAEQHFSLHAATAPVLQNGLGADLANSFIAVASKADVAVQPPDGALAVYFGNGWRKNGYLKTTRFVGDKNGLRICRSTYFDTTSRDNAEFKMVLEDEEFVDGTPWVHALYRIMLDPSWSIDKVAKWSRRWVDALMVASGQSPQKLPSKDDKLPAHFFDAIPKNLLIDDTGTAKFIDLEWHSKSTVSFGTIFVRGLIDSLRSIEIAAFNKQPYEILEITKQVGAELDLVFTRDELERLVSKELAFQASVSRVPVRNSGRYYFLPVRPAETKSGRNLRRYRRRLRNKFKLRDRLSHWWPGS